MVVVPGPPTHSVVPLWADRVFRRYGVWMTSVSRPSGPRKAAPLSAAPDASGPAPQPGAAPAATPDNPRLSDEARAFAARPAPTPDAKRPLDLRLAAVRASGTTHSSETGIDARASSMEDTLDAGALVLSAPDGLSAPSSEGAGGTKVSPDSRGVSISHSALSGGVKNDVTAGLSRASLSAGYTRTSDGVARSGSVSVMDGFASLNGDVTWTRADGGAARAGGWVGGWKDEVFVGGDVGRTDAAGRTGVLSGYVGGGASRSVTDLGTVDAQGPEALRGQRRIEYTRSLATYGGVHAGVAALMGLGGGLTATRSKEVIYRTHVGQDRAAELLHDKHGLARALADRAKAVGLADEPVVLPDLSRPETLKPGDELLLTTSGKCTMGLVVGVGGITAGALVSLQGTFELAARRLDSTRVELCVTPTDIRGMEATAGFPFVADARASNARAAAMRQAFVFDLSNPAGRAAYDRALRGELPGSLQDHQDIQGTPADALKAVLEKEALPAGVERTHLARLEANRTRVGVGFNYGPVQEGGWAGLSWHRTRGTQSSETVTRDGVLAETTRGVETRREVLLSGVETAGVSGSLRQVSLYAEDGTPTRHFDGLTLKAHFADSRVRGLELNDEVLDLLNQALGTDLKPFARQGRNHSRSITLERTLDAAALGSLSKASASDVEKHAAAAGLSSSDARALVERLRAAPEPAAQAEQVQAFLSDHGLKGLGFIHRTLGGTLALTTESSAYSRAGEQARELSLRFRAPVAANDDNGAVSTRFDLVSSALTDAADSLQDAKGDPLLTPGERTATAARLQDAMEELSGLVRVDHLPLADRRAMHGRLAQGWTTSAEERVMKALEAVGL